MQEQIEFSTSTSDSEPHMDKQSHDAQFWFVAADGTRYYAKEKDDHVVLLNYDDGGDLWMSRDEFQRDIMNGNILDYGIE